jgi:hypothetical protein
LVLGERRRAQRRQLGQQSRYVSESPQSKIIVHSFVIEIVERVCRAPVAPFTAAASDMEGQEELHCHAQQPFRWRFCNFIRDIASPRSRRSAPSPATGMDERAGRAEIGYHLRMGWRYRRRLRLARGLYLNLGKTGITSISAGGRGARMTFGRRGGRATVGLPGSGLSYTAYEPYTHVAPPARPGEASAAPAHRRDRPGTLLHLAILAMAAIAIVAILAAVARTPSP